MWCDDTVSVAIKISSQRFSILDTHFCWEKSTADALRISRCRLTLTVLSTLSFSKHFQAQQLRRVAFLALTAFHPEHMPTPTRIRNIAHNMLNIVSAEESVARRNNVHEELKQCSGAGELAGISWFARYLPKYI
jgi:hypothetical protein